MLNNQPNPNTDHQIGEMQSTLAIISSVSTRQRQFLSNKFTVEPGHIIVNLYQVIYPITEIEPSGKISASKTNSFILKLRASAVRGKKIANSKIAQRKLKMMRVEKGCLNKLMLPFRILPPPARGLLAHPAM
jgi:hypothetical protein